MSENTNVQEEKMVEKVPTLPYAQLGTSWHHTDGY
jgi:hypothetical protein